MNQKQPEPVLSGRICPVHGASANVTIAAGSLRLRCCCDFFLRKHISRLNSKLKGKSLDDLFNDWETDLLMNELQAEQGIACK